MLWQTLPTALVEAFDHALNDGFFLVSFGFLAVELVAYAFRRKFSWRMLVDAGTNYVTLIAFLVTSAVLVGGFYVPALYLLHGVSLFDIAVTPWSIGVAVVLADLLYYWEHRLMHRINLGWATHSVHHSSPFFNISVAYRFGPMDGVWPVVGSLILVGLGFDPVVVVFAEGFVQLFQTALHTEVITKLPRPIEYVFNTPSHHRVHHGSNPAYLDTNYGGIFILWDRWFGTFAEEREKVVYGLTVPLSSLDPITAFFHGFYRLGRKFLAMPGLSGKVMALLGPPGWTPATPEVSDADPS